MSEIAKLDTKFDAKLDAMEARSDAKFDAVDSRFESIDSKLIPRIVALLHLHRLGRRSQHEPLPRIPVTEDVGGSFDGRRRGARSEVLGVVDV